MKKSRSYGLLKEIDGHFYYNDYCIDKLPIFEVMVDYKITGRKWIIQIDEKKLKVWVKRHKVKGE